MNWHTGLHARSTVYIQIIDRFESQGNECQQIYNIIDIEIHS